jgi:hypothetical protein
MTKEEMARIIEKMPKEDQIWLMNLIIRRFWPEFEGKPVAFYDPSEFWDDWEDEEVDRFYDGEENIQTRRRSDS